MITHQHRPSKPIGYVKNDNRNSGGILQEDDIVGCSHCQKAMNLKTWKEKGGWCSACDAHVCFICAERTKKEGCITFKQMIDTHLEAQAQRSQLERTLGL